MSEIRLRFAPSPTGYLHLGGARTAIFNWLYARHHGGSFILRIEDTDRSRSTEEYTQAIFDSLHWLGLDWDEGPYFQSERLSLYQKEAQRLLDSGLAYRCVCTPEELEQMRKEALASGQKPKYDGRCREAGYPASRRPSVIRFKTPTVGQTKVQDLVRGEVTFENTELDDLIIFRTDGHPTYNFAAVVDDAHLRITHIIRGDDHLANTPRQILLYQALDYPIPRFAHVPLILGQDKARLSKRHGATSVGAYRDLGYLPWAMVNYLVRLGWSSGDEEIFSKEELVGKFGLDRLGSSAGIFDPQKLLWLNFHYIKEGEPHRLAQLLIPFLEKRGYLTDDPEWLAEVVKNLQPRSRTLDEMAEGAEIFFREPLEYDPKLAIKLLRPELAEPLSAFRVRLRSLTSFTPPAIAEVFQEIITEAGLKLKDLAQPVRFALTGRTVSPGLYETIALMGREKTLQRLTTACAYIRQRSAA